MSDYEIIDNFLPKEKFKNLKNVMENNDFPWYFVPDVAFVGKEIYDGNNLKSYFQSEEELINAERTQEEIDWSFYSIHTIYANNIIFSNQLVWNSLQSVLGVLQPNALIRAKANAYTRTPNLIYHQPHRDFQFEHKACIFSINDCDGFTILEDGTKVESVANRALIFDGSTPHHSTSCTNSARRLNINLNYF